MKHEKAYKRLTGAGLSRSQAKAIIEVVTEHSHREFQSARGVENTVDDSGQHEPASDPAQGDSEPLEWVIPPTG